MAGAKPARNFIAANIVRHLGNALENATKEYFVLTSDTKADRLNTSIYLKSIDCTLELKKIYKGVMFAE